MRLFILLVAFALTACSTGNKVVVPARLNNWIGHDTDELVRSWGPPDRSYDFKDGSRTIEYENNRVESYGGWNRPNGAVAVGPNGTALGVGVPLWMDEPTVSVRRCTIKFETDKRRIIRTASYQGSNCSYALIHGRSR